MQLFVFDILEQLQLELLLLLLLLLHAVALVGQLLLQVDSVLVLEPVFEVTLPLHLLLVELLLVVDDLHPLVLGEHGCPIDLWFAVLYDDWARY